MNNPDTMLRELVAARDLEVQEKAAARRAARAELEQRGQRNTERAMSRLGDMAEVVRRLGEESNGTAEEAHQQVQQLRAQLTEGPKGDESTRFSDRAAVVTAAQLYAVLSPYYVRLYNSDGTNYYTSYNPGNVDLWDDAQGSGSGIFGTGAASIFTSRGVDTVIVTGSTTSGCVRASAVDALQSGFRVVIPRECVADRAPGPHEANLFDLHAKYADVLGLDEVLAVLAEIDAQHDAV